MLVGSNVIAAFVVASGFALHFGGHLFTGPAAWRELFANGILPPGNRLSRVQILQLHSQNQLKGIMHLVLDYEREHHGAAPQALSRIVPDGREDLWGIFSAPTEPGNPRPDAGATSRDTVDRFSDYGMLSSSTTGSLIFERPGLWPDLTVAVCDTKLVVTRLSALQFQKLTATTPTATWSGRRTSTAP